MKARSLIFSMVLLGFFSVKSEAQSMFIETENGSLVSNPVESVQNLTFPDNNLVVKLWDQSTETFNLIMVRKIYFDESSSTNEMNLIQANIHLSPNPVQDYFTLENLPENISSIAVYSIRGERILQFDSDQSSFYVGMLKNGMYLLRVNNEFVKFIKL